MNFVVTTTIASTTQINQNQGFTSFIVAKIAFRFVHFFFSLFPSPVFYLLLFLMILQLECHVESILIPKMFN